MGVRPTKLMTPIQLPDESQRAYDAFKAYCGDRKRSIRRCARKLGKSSTIIARWSRRHKWQTRLRKLELQDCQRAVAADEAAKLSVAEERAREQMKFQQRALDASKRATERGLQILKQSVKGTRPQDAARLLAVGDAIGRATLGLSGASTGGAFGLPIATPNIKVVVHEDEQSRERRRHEAAFFSAHPELNRPPDILKVLNATIIDENGVARSANDDDGRR
jgi:hypothetical protein